MVERYHPGHAVTFRFKRPRGWRGTHGFLIEARSDGGARLTHELRMEASGSALILWFLVFRPLHDCVIEEAFDQVAVDLGEPPRAPQWSRRVRLLRWGMRAVRRVRYH